MKRLSFLSLFCIALLLLVGCDSGGDDGGSVDPGTFVAKIDGSDFQALSASAVYVASGVGGQPQLTIIAASQTLSSFNFTLLPFNGEGMYRFGQGNVGQVGVSNGTGQGKGYLASESGDGSIEITEQTENGVAGTFSFTARNDDGTSVQVTDGQFNLTFAQ
ncbi:MAG TPA: DUF6252 family protein [Rhodothermales bacterium]|nr:DUF6252 family protein [Rhodothermales bacterium]